MELILKLIYNLIALPLLFVVSKILVLTNNKMKHREEFVNSYLDVPQKRGKRILIHSASMGEFEQVKYLVELIRKNEPDTEVVVSFFSSSGFINLNDKLYYDFKVYLPLDFKGRMKKFVNHLNPDMVLIVRYDLWLNFIITLDKNKTPIHLINATYTVSKSLGKKYVGVKFYRLTLKHLSSIYCVNEYHKNKFEQLKLQTVIKLAPDTRYDRVVSKVESSANNELLNIDDATKVLVVGSCWRLDVKLISQAVKKIKRKHKLLVIYVPHEVGEKNIANVVTHIPNSYIYSELTEHQVIDKDLIVDKVGLLLDLYKYADITYVGGAFGAGVHSVTEPAGYGIPIFCGNQYYKNSEDARELTKLSGLVPISDSYSLETALIELLENEEERNRIGNINKTYIYGLTGSSKLVYDNLVKQPV